SGHPLREAHRHRVVEENRSLRGSAGDRSRARDAVDQERDRNEEAGQRAGRAHVDQSPLVPDRLLDADERAEGSDEIQERRRDEVRQRGGESIPAAHEVVAELVAPENQEKRNRKGEAVREMPAAQEPSGIGEGTARDRRREERGREEPEVEQGMLGETEAREASARRRLLRDRRRGRLLPEIHGAAVISQRDRKTGSGFRLEKARQKGGGGGGAAGERREILGGHRLAHPVGIE